MIVSDADSDDRAHVVGDQNAIPAPACKASQEETPTTMDTVREQFQGGNEQPPAHNSTSSSSDNASGMKKRGITMIGQLTSQVEPFGNMGKAASLVMFMAVFIVLFHRKFTTKRGAVVLILFCNALLTYWEIPFQFSTTPETLHRYALYDTTIAHLERYVVCPKCHALYSPGARHSTCTFVAYPMHPQLAKRSFCGKALYNSSNTGCPTSVAKKVFTYNSLKDNLQLLFLRPEFEKQVRAWHKRRPVAGMLCDVYDGYMWKNIKDQLNRAFVDDWRSLLLTLNIDWFKPFKNSTYSCGAIYLAVNNLPRSERFKPENIILVGVMPGPTEPKKAEINHYLKPLVDELLELYTGINISTYEEPSGTRIRAASLNTECDLPASRKINGFTSHVSYRGCPKCDRSFGVSKNGTIDYSGFDVDSWMSRTKEMNMKDAQKWKAATNDKTRSELKKQSGTRWSELHRLPYYDVVRCATVDPMHNLFLGTAKRLAEHWTNGNEGPILKPKDLREIQDLADQMILPHGWDSVSGKIAQGFSYMKASEWKSWVIIYSPYVLRDYLPKRYLDNGIEFVNA